MAPKQAQLNHALLGLSDKGRAIKGLIVCYVAWLGSMIYGMGLVPCYGQDGYQAQVPQHPIDACRYNIIFYLYFDLIL